MKEDYEKEQGAKAMENSREERRKILAQLGFEPFSLWWMQPRKADLDEYVSDKVATEAHSYTKHSFSTRAGALSQNPTAVIERIIKFYGYGITNGNMFNPFMERMPHLLIGHKLGWNVFGYDIAKEAWEHDRTRLKELINAQYHFAEPDIRTGIIAETPVSIDAIISGRLFSIYNADSRCTHYGINEMDLIFGSPPYWDIEFYGTESGQLGYNTTYPTFLSNLTQVAKECERILKPGGLIIWQVNDFRKDGKFYSYHSDVIHMFEAVGLSMWDILIYNISLHPLRSIFTTELVRDKYTAKCHEYAIVAKKL